MLLSHVVPHGRRKRSDRGKPPPVLRPSTPGSPREPPGPQGWGTVLRNMRQTIFFHVILRVGRVRVDQFSAEISYIRFSTTQYLHHDSTRRPSH